jgi:hypothetical protein
MRCLCRELCAAELVAPASCTDSWGGLCEEERGGEEDGLMRDVPRSGLVCLIASRAVRGLMGLDMGMRYA